MMFQFDLVFKKKSISNRRKQRTHQGFTLNCFILILIFFFKGSLCYKEGAFYPPELFGNYLPAINVDTHIMDVTKKSPYPSRKGRLFVGAERMLRV